MEIIEEKQITDYHKIVLDFLNRFEKDRYFYGYPISKDFEMRLYCEKHGIYEGKKKLIQDVNNLNNFDNFMYIIQRNLNLSRRSEFNKNLLKERALDEITIKGTGKGDLSLVAKIVEGNNHNTISHKFMLNWKMNKKLFQQPVFFEDLNRLIAFLRETK